MAASTPEAEAAALRQQRGVAEEGREVKAEQGRARGEAGAVECDGGAVAA